MSRVEDALKLRDIVQQIIDDKLGKDRPRSSYATVVGYNPALGTVSVIYEGDTVAVDIPAGSIYPSKPGQTVRIGGGTGSKVIEDVYGETLADVKTKTAQETADGKNTVNYGNEEPPGTDHSIGDIWFDENNIPHVWNGSEWESVADKRVDTIKAVQDELARDLNDVVENGVGTKTHYTPTQPAIADSKEGDLWFNTSEGGYNEVWIFTNGAWVSAADARLKTLLDAQAELERDIDTAMTSAAGKNKVFYQPTQPSGSDLKDGDLWFNTTSGKNNELKVYSGGAWKLATDSRIDAIKSAQDQLSTDLNAVKTTANSKNTTYYQVTQPSGASLRDGDLWFNTTSGKNNELKVYSGGAWKLATDLRIDAIQTAQTTMQGDITTAQQKADQAFQNAAAADSKAVTAQSTADTAKTDAATAAGIANGKGKVLIQSTAPATADRLAQNLWIDTTGGANTPKRWSGSAWVAVTDKAATDAASAAVAAQTKADQAKSAADAAQAAADAAQATASAAQATATAAQTSANTKNRITRSTANPSTPYDGRVDDTWFVMSTLGASGRVLSQYKWNGSSWVSEAIGGEVIAYLDAAKITTGYLSADRIAANSLNAGAVLVNGSVGSTLIAGGAITTDKIAVGAITAESGVVSSLDAGKIVVGTLDAARIAANSITVDKMLVGNSANIVPNLDGDARDTSGWTGAPLTFTRDTPNGTGFVVQPGSKARSDISATVPIDSNLKYTIEAQGKMTAAERFTVGVRWYNATGTYLSVTWIRVDSTTPDAWVKTVATLTPPATATALSVLTYASDNGSTNVTTTFTVRIRPQVDSTLISDGSIVTSKIAVGAITAESGVVASLDAGKIVVGTLDAARIAANSITASKVLLSSSQNLVNDPTFAAVSLGWTSYGNANLISQWSKVDDGGSALQGVSTGSGWVELMQSEAVPVSVGERVYAEVEARVTANWATGNPRLGIWFFNAAGSRVIGNIAATVPATQTSWAKFSGYATAPSGATHARLIFSLQSTAAAGSTARFRNPLMRTQVGATLIEDGAITTNKIAVGSITAASGIIASIDAGKITVGQMDGSRITANSIQADTVLVSGSIGSTLIRDGAITTAKIAAGAITAESGIIGSLDASKITVGTLSGARLAADAINGMQIIGATIATSTGFPRVQMDTTGLAVYKSSAVRSFFADSSTGDLSLVGDFATDISGRERVYLSNSLWNSIQVTNESGSVSGYSPGSGVRVGSSDKDSIDLYHASNVSSNNVTVNSGMVMGPKPSGTPRGAMLQLARSTPSSGSQWTFGSISAFDANNSQVSSITATGYAGGYVFVRGNRLITLESGSAGAASDGIQFSAPKSYPFTFDGGDPENGISVIRFRSRGRRYASLTYDVPNGVTLETTTSSTDPDLGNVPLTLNGGDLARAGYPFITLTPGDNTIVASAGNVRPLDIRYDGTASTWGVSFRKGTEEWGQVGSPSGSAAADFGIVSAAGRDLFLSTVSKSSSLRLKGGTTGKADFLMTADGWNWAGAPTASATANVNMTSGGWIQRTSSSRRYKIMEKPLLESDPDLTLKLLSIEPKSWFDKASADRWAEIDSMKAGGEWTEEMEDTYIPDPLTRIPGVIAEDLDDAGLDMFVEYDANGAPESVLYDRIGVALIEVLKAQDGRIKALEDTLAKMGQVD